MIPAMKEFRGTINGNREFHTGIDLVKTHQAPINAFVAGEVIHAKEGVAGSGFGGYGIVVAIRDPETGHLHCYAHLDSVAVKVGDKVKQGQLIGRQGNTGQSTGSHLHYEIRKSSSPQYGWIADREKNCFEPVKYLDDYFTKAQNDPKPVDKPVNKQADEKTKEALKVLQSEQVIQSPAYWLENAFEGGTVRGDYAALLIQNMAKRLATTGTVPETPKPEPEKPVKQPKPWAEIEKLTQAASVHVDVGGGGTGVLLKGGLLLTAKHVSKGRASIRFKTNSRHWYTADMVSEHPGVGKDAVDLALYRIENAPANLPYLPVNTEPLVTGQKLLTVEAEYTEWITRSGQLCQISTAKEPWEFDCSIPAQHGNSGGAAVNEYGEVVGVIVNLAFVGIQKGSVRESSPGCEAVNLIYPAVVEWLKKYM
ncbi:peptidoglycan DD-metalloendopeptidase family protein [uncultured Brevibacillus sp.]|uniref:peptidoglycan DD-metalloendopeptidase family protein n=1 Tax=uncultured Brevibacillus sp. TaxID=169970 RepID=UPI00259244BF|nr:peptidoglycan DD-metalloendopeptidase family protein [uncultured Brevibacillus sp.]